MDPNIYSPLPYFMRVRGSVLPKMILPLFFIAGWSTMITCITKFVWPLAVNSLPPLLEFLTDSVILTVIGFVVALALSFRCTTAYERYIDGIKYVHP